MDMLPCYVILFNNGFQGQMWPTAKERHIKMVTDIPENAFS